MNISPVSFGKVVEVRGKTKSTAHNIASLANSSVENKTHKAIQKDAKELFDDVTPKGKVRVYEAPSGEVFLLSGKDAEVVTFDERAAARKIRREETSHKLIDWDYIKEIKELTDLGIKQYIKTHMEPFAITVGEVKGEHRLQYEIE